MSSMSGPSTTLSHYLAQRTAPMVALALDAIRADVDFYGTLPAETIDGDVRRIIRVNFELFVRTLAAAEIPSATDFESLSVSASQRADEEVPLTEVLAAYHTGARAWWTQITADVADGLITDVDIGPLGQSFLTFVHAATTAVVTGYEADRSAQPTHAGHTELFAALIHNDDIVGTAERFGLTVAQHYWLLCLQVGPSADERNSAVASTVAARRKTRRLQRHLRALGFGETLHAITDDGGIALLPVRATQSRAELIPHLDALPARLQATCLIAMDCVAPTEISTRLPETQRVLRVAHRTGWTRTIVELADVAVEYQLSIPTRARDLIGASLAPITDDAALVETLRMYLRCNANSAETAQALHVHPNTVLYRLRKISESTGLNLSRPADLVRAFAALSVETPIAAP